MLSKENSKIYTKLYSEKKIDKILSDESFINKILIFEKMLVKANYDLKFLSYKAYQNINKDLLFDLVLQLLEDRATQVSLTVRISSS